LVFFWKILILCFAVGEEWIKLPAWLP